MKGIHQTRWAVISATYRIQGLNPEFQGKPSKFAAALTLRVQALRRTALPSRGVDQDDARGCFLLDAIPVEMKFLRLRGGEMLPERIGSHGFLQADVLDLAVFEVDDLVVEGASDRSVSLVVATGGISMGRTEIMLCKEEKRFFIGN